MDRPSRNRRGPHPQVLSKLASLNLKPKPSSSKNHPFPDIPNYLNPPRTVLLVDMAEPLALLALLEQTGRGHDEEDVDADHAEQGREDVVEEDVGKGRDGRDAPAHECRRALAGAGGVGDEEGRGRAVEVAAAGELFCVLD